MERRLIGIATGEIKKKKKHSVGWRGKGSRPPGPHAGKNNSETERQYSFHYRLRYQTSIRSHGGRRADFFFLPKCSKHMNSHNYLYTESRSDRAPASLTSSPRSCTTRTILLLIESTPPPCGIFNSSTPPTKQLLSIAKISPKLHTAPTLHSLKREASRLSFFFFFFFQCQSTSNRVARNESFCRAARLRGCHRRCSL